MTRISRRTLVAAALLTTLVLAPQPGEAWGRQGHRIVARIAARALTADVRTKLAAILGVTDAGLERAMANASIWPDVIDKRATGTSSWHYINVPVFAPFTTAGLCPNHDCVIDRIDEMRLRLQTNRKGFTLAASPSPPRTMTSQQLAFLIHFVGDIHQPLHAVANGDRGGDCVLLTRPLRHGNGSADTTKLHGAWDVDTVLAVMKANLGSEARTTTVLVQRLESGAAVTQGTPADWARESHEIARTAVYEALKVGPMSAAAPGACAAGIRPVSIDQAYLSANVAIVERRLMQAGARLSNMLNEICRGNGCMAKP